jgi:endonuclease YncB( thermonuclease family)
MYRKFLPLTALLLTSALGCSPASTVSQAPASAPNQLPSVVRVTGGNTLVVQDRGQEVPTTLACVAAPPQASADTALLSSLLPAGQAVQMRQVGERGDQTVAELFLGNQPVGLRLVQEGAAMVDPNAIADCPDTAELYWQAQIEAQQNRRGLWADYSLKVTAPIDLEPNLSLPVQASSGECPEAIDMWAFRKGFEGGADHIAVVNMPQVSSSPVRQISSTADEVVFATSLRPEFSQCSGTARSDQMAMYRADLDEGELRFTVDLRGDGRREALHTGVSADRPYVFWRALE